VFYLKETKLVLRLYTHLFPSIFFLDFIETETYGYCFSYEDVMIISQLIQINMIRFEFSNFNVTYDPRINSASFTNNVKFAASKFNVSDEAILLV